MKTILLLLVSNLVSLTLAVITGMLALSDKPYGWVLFCTIITAMKITNKDED